MLQDAESKSEMSQGISAREHFVFTDTDGQVYHITVEGNTVKDGARIPPDVSDGITCSVIHDLETFSICCLVKKIRSPLTHCSIKPQRICNLALQRHVGLDSPNMMLI